MVIITKMGFYNNLNSMNDKDYVIYKFFQLYTAVKYILCARQRHVQKLS